MSTAERGMLEGTVMVRPWRVGLLTDVNSRENVAASIKALSDVWGGYYFPIIDRAAPPTAIDRICAIYDIDSLYTDDTEGDVADLVRRPGYEWPGRGPWGPFHSDEGRIRKGVLQTVALLRHEPEDTYLLPSWDASDANNLLYLANWGDSSGLADNSRQSSAKSVSLDLLPVRSDDPKRVGAIQASRFRVRPSGRRSADLDGLCIVNVSDPSQVVHFWNQRATGAELFAISNEDCEPLWEYLRLHLRKFTTSARSADANGDSLQVLQVWRFDELHESLSERLTEWAVSNNCELRFRMPVDIASHWTVFDIETNYEMPIRSEFHPGSTSARIAIPSIPWRDADIAEYFPGTVAAMVSISSESGQDPRLTSNIPPFRRHSKLLSQGIARQEVEQARVCYNGVAFLVQASATEFSFPFVHNLDAVRLLFDDKKSQLTQSDNGRFQSRAGEMLGGPFSNSLQQPAVREVLKAATTKHSGISLQEIRSILRDKRGDWPDQLFSPNVDASAYADYQTGALLNTGLLVPLLDVHCSFCRVVSQVHPKDLDSVVQCQFCGETFKLALSLNLTKPNWRFKLAGHLPTAKVEAMMPVLAGLSVLSQLEHDGSPRLCHALGAELQIRGKKVEMDIVALIRDHSPAVVLGEVKNSNRIDEKDVSNVEFLQRCLSEVGVRCVPLFVTLKEKFGESEVAILREHCERAVRAMDHWTGAVPIFPLLFTAADLSRPWSHEDHPWKWSRENVRLGLYGKAIESCRRNIGLKEYEVNGSGDQAKISIKWD